MAVFRLRKVGGGSTLRGGDSLRGSAGPASHALEGALTVSVSTASTLSMAHVLSGALTASITVSGTMATPHPLAGGLAVTVTAEGSRLTMEQPLGGALTMSVAIAGSLVAPAGSTALVGALTVSVSASATTLRIQLPGPYTSTGWNTTNGSTTITGGTASASDVGALVTGPGIPAGTRIVSVTP